VISSWKNYPYGASVEDALKKLEYDLFYIKNMSILLDIKILLKTIGIVLFGQGAR
jgi:lipopolysaccharide/colanic/teichoic acid biosynthesis glycosyltransferase